MLILILVAALLGAAFASLSNGIGMLARQRETLIGAVSLVLLPLTFLSSALMQQSLVPGWIRTVSKLNPVNWAVEAGRSAAMQKIDWGLVGSRVGLLVALVVALRGVRDARLRHLPALALTTRASASNVGPTPCGRGKTDVRAAGQAGGPPADPISTSARPRSPPRPCRRGRRRRRRARGRTDAVDVAADDVDAVVARAAGDRVGIEVAEDLVVARAAGDVVEAAVAGDVVVAGVAEDAVVAGAPGHRVVAGTAVELVVAVLAVDVVVAAGAEQRVAGRPCRRASRRPACRAGRRAPACPR